MVATKYYVALGKCHYKAHVVILLDNLVFLLLLSVFTTRYSTHTLTGAIVGILAWMAFKRLLAGTKGPIKE